MDIGIKAALGYNPRSTVEWKGNRPSTRMGAVAMLRENFIKARKMQGLYTVEWKGNRPSTRMGAVAMLRENFIKARKESHR
jgi:hypothetical protein